MKTRNSGPVAGIAAPLWALVHRFYFFLLIFAAIALMMVGRLNPVVIDVVRARATDAVSPVLDLFSRPAATVASGIEYIHQLIDLHDENVRLRQENARLQQWQFASVRLEAENRSLRTLLAFKPDPATSFITARVIADPGGSFVRTLVVTVGRRGGVKRGMAAMAGQGLIGRVVQVGEWSSRILLITDLNSRIPVVLETSRQRAMLSGDNADRPRLMYVPRGAQVARGERIFTSGHGGLYPPGLPIGIVDIPEVQTAAGDGAGVPAVASPEVRVMPLVDMSRVEHVQLVDFGVPGGLAAEAVQPGGMQ